MTDEFDGFDDPRMGNPWLRYAMLCLNIIGLVYVLIGLVGGPGYGYLLSPDLGLMAAIGVGVGLAAVSIFVALACFITAFLLARKSKIGWVLGLVIAALFIGSCPCTPFSIVILVGLLNEKSRKIYLG